MQVSLSLRVNTEGVMLHEAALWNLNSLIFVKQTDRGQITKGKMLNPNEMFSLICNTSYFSIYKQHINS